MTTSAEYAQLLKTEQQLKTNLLVQSPRAVVAGVP